MTFKYIKPNILREKCLMLYSLVQGPLHWQQFIAADSQEFVWAWTTMAEEASEIFNFLGKEFTGPLPPGLSLWQGQEEKVLVDQQDGS